MASQLFRIRPLKRSTAPTLAFTEGKPISDFAKLEAWLSTQPDGYIEYKVGGTWWAAAKEAHPFILEAGRVYCAHPSYKSQKGLDPADYSGFFAYEAWMRASRAASFFSGIGAWAGDIADHAAEHIQTTGKD